MVNDDEFMTWEAKNEFVEPDLCPLPNGALPNVLSHYFRRVSEPFRTLSDLHPDEVQRVIAGLASKEPLPRRLTTADYLPKRRAIERIMREQFLAKGGRPPRTVPHYMVLGRWSHWDLDEGFDSVTLPLRTFSSEIISFTYPDSWVSFTGRLLSGEQLPRFPYHGQVYRLEELESLVAEFGLPGERWRTEHDRRMETYIEAQVWDDIAISPLTDD